MARKESTVLVAGDVTVDWFMYPVKASDEGDNWRLHDALHSDVLPGGAALLTSFIQQSIKEDGILAVVKGPELPEKRDIRSISPDEIIHSNAILDNCKDLDNKKAEVLRIKSFLGYIGPSGNKLPLLTLSLESNELDAEIIVLDDAGNGFRKMKKLWPKALESGEDSIIIYKMSLPLLEGRLWKKICEKSRKNFIAIINASDLRRTAGIHISKSLSWDRTTKDLAFELQRADALNSLHQCPYLVVLFGTEGAILYHRKEEKEDDVFIIFDPNLLEDSFASNIDGSMIGLTSIFTATLVKQLTKGNLSDFISGTKQPTIDILNQESELVYSLKAGIKQGLANSRALLEIGYKKDNGIKYPDLKEVLEKSGKYTYVCSHFKNPKNLASADPHFWRILDNEALRFRQLVAREIVLKGESEGLENVPICKFGDLDIIDRAEIESYSPIRELINEFLLNPKPKNPLCFAVFGPPGSGKSLGVKQIIKSIDSNEDKLKSISFNVSQFGDYQDLVNAFHKVRDIALSGKIPFVFFDEFDSYKGQPLGWLKCFLAPMQDGEFKEGDSVHPIGNAIFVFAGGTSYTFEDFVKSPRDSGSTVNSGSSADRKADESYIQNVEEAADKAFKDAKGPDFVSRLRGFINVMGPNRQHTKHDDDAFIIRRAKVLRALLEKEQPASGLFNSKKEINIDEGVLRAMLNVTSYKHGTRSMTALIQMSRLAGKNRFDLSALPLKEQLDMHVDADEFLFLAEKERYQSMLRLQDLPDPEETSYLKKERDIVNAVAASIHKYYMSRPDEERKKLNNDISFEEARDAAEDIPNKLWAIRNGIQKITNETPQIPDITGDEIEIFAHLEYERRCRNQRVRELSVSGENRASNISTAPMKNYSSTSYGLLTEEEKDKFRELVYAIPPILKNAGYEIYRMKKVQEITDPKTIDHLARVLHEEYFGYRESQGENREMNPSLVGFDDLPDDIKEANYDNIKKIPEKLSWIGYSTRRIQDDNQTEITLTKKEIKKMAIREHDRWVWQKIMQGWIYKAGVKDFVNKTTPFIVPWHRLPRNIRDNDCNAVRLIPRLLKEAGYEAYKPDK